MSEQAEQQDSYWPIFKLGYITKTVWKTLQKQKDRQWYCLTEQMQTQKKLKINQQTKKHDLLLSLLFMVSF